jgi:hypothetical protein
VNAALLAAAANATPSHPSWAWEFTRYGRDHGGIGDLGLKPGQSVQRRDSPGSTDIPLRWRGFRPRLGHGEHSTPPARCGPPRRRRRGARSFISLRAGPPAQASIHCSRTRSRNRPHSRRPRPASQRVGPARPLRLKNPSQKKSSQYCDTALMRHASRIECTKMIFGARTRYSDNVPRDATDRPLLVSQSSSRGNSWTTAQFLTSQGMSRQAAAAVRCAQAMRSSYRVWWRRQVLSGSVGPLDGGCSCRV